MAGSIAQQLEELLNPLPKPTDPEDEENEGIANMTHLPLFHCFKNVLNGFMIEILAVLSSPVLARCVCMSVL